MKIVADESVDFGIILKLRGVGMEVLSISELFSGIKDEEVLNIAFINQCILITEDKDFGELTYRLKLEHKGILLIRLSDVPRKERIKMVVDLVYEHFVLLSNNFSVLDKRGIRIKTGHNKIS